MTEETTAASPVPPAPAALGDTGLSADQLGQLLLKSLIVGEASGTEIGDRLALSYSILEALLHHARVEKLIEVRSASGAGTAGYRYALTDLGRERAMQFMEVSQYNGAAPVPLSQYVAYMRALQASRGFLDRERLASGFSNLIVSRQLIDRLGPAVNSGKSLFLYGAPGNGKTVVAEGCGKAMGGEMYVPQALDVGGQTITIFDPVNHRRLQESRQKSGLIASTGFDRRWVKISRPVVVVGGELTLDMLDLAFNPISRFYEAPLQLKANGGVFVVDDFGRQRISPRELLNRWIVPLEGRRDYLTMHTGRKFEIPFDVLIIFATNLQPESLADEAFLRRIPYKIAAQDPTPDEYERIFELNCRRYGVPFDPEMVAYLNRELYEARNIPRRACHPRDLIEQVVNKCRYLGREPRVTRDLLDEACFAYFLQPDTVEVPGLESLETCR